MECDPSPPKNAARQIGLCRFDLETTPFAPRQLALNILQNLVPLIYSNTWTQGGKTLVMQPFFGC